MKYKHARYNSILKIITNKDKLFSGKYTIDPYQNCEFGCKYCDSTLEDTIYVKTNAVQLLKKELEHIKQGIIIVGSVVDPYQKAEEKYRITRGLLEIIEQLSFPCHILTKSDLILRDIDILSKISKCLVTISITTLNKQISDVFEKDVPHPIKRLKTVEKLSEVGITTGLAVIPILPFFVEEELEEIVKMATRHKAHYVLHKHLELKGDQKNVFMNTLEEFDPDLVEKYEKLYKDSYMPKNSYISKINDTVDKLCVNYNVKNRI